MGRNYLGGDGITVLTCRCDAGLDCPIHGPVNEHLISASELLQLRQAAKAGSDLAYWASAINWDRRKNTPEWMAGLRSRIMAVNPDLAGCMPETPR